MKENNAILNGNPEEKLEETILFFENLIININSYIGNDVKRSLVFDRLNVINSKFSVVVSNLKDYKDGIKLNVDKLPLSLIKNMVIEYKRTLNLLKDLSKGHYYGNSCNDKLLKIHFTPIVKSYIKLALDIFENNLTTLGVDLKTGKFQVEKVTSYTMIEESHPIMKYINSNTKLIKLNKLRKRNLIVFDNNTHQVIYDLKIKDIVLVPKIPFSDFEHDTNRKFAERMCVYFLYNFNDKKEYFTKLLKKNEKLYRRELSIIDGKEEPSTKDILVLISLLARLDQQNSMGPITVLREEKLFPSLISKHSISLTYIKETLITLEKFRQEFYIDDFQLLHIHDVDYNLIKEAEEEIGFQKRMFLEVIKEDNNSNKKVKISTGKIQGNFESANYLESFFRKMCNLERFIDVTPYFNSVEDLSELINFSKRFKHTQKQHDFVVAAKVRAILGTFSHEELIYSVHEVRLFSRENTYSLKVADYLISFEDKIVQELYRLYFIFDNHIEKEKSYFIENFENKVGKFYNDSYISIGSDMHFNNLTNFEKSNYSNNFNIIAGDFADNLYHRGNSILAGTMDIPGIGVLGNHDIYLKRSPTKDLTREINTNYKKSITVLKKSFPNIKILNDEIIYNDGYAIIGMTLVYDIHNGVRTFFANEDWGLKFINDDYMERAKLLLDKVSKNIPIIFITHSPFKEYAVCKNKEIGVPSKKIFKDYPNVKIYIHGHGHSEKAKKVIDNILCISNPLIMNKSVSEMSFSEKELMTLLNKKNKILL